MNTDLQPTRQLRFPIGTDIEVRDRFCANWQRGFEVADAYQHGYRVRRRSDGYVLPVPFGTEEIRRAT
jgi:hypothetical protein